LPIMTNGQKDPSQRRENFKRRILTGRSLQRASQAAVLKAEEK
jgi:hypothetical protein